MGNLPLLLTTLLPIIGIIIGASLQYFFSKSGERRKQLEILKTQAYVDYLRSVALIANFGTGEFDKLIELQAALADAKTRICIYGSAKVIDALASLEKVGPVLDSSNSRENFLVVCNEMRQQSVGAAEIVQTEKLKLILFGRED